MQAHQEGKGVEFLLFETNLTKKNIIYTVFARSFCILVNVAS